MTNSKETADVVFVKAFSIEVAARGGGDYLAQITNARTIFDEFEIVIKEGKLLVYAVGLSGMVERPYRSGENTFPVGDYRVKRATVEAWLSRAQQAAIGEQASATATPSDGERRLDQLRLLGGSAKYVKGAWTFTGIGKLVVKEKDEDRPRHSEKTIRADLKEAAQAEHDAKRAGNFERLGQR